MNDRMRLTPREIEICRAIAQGKMNKQIASDSGRSIYTIRAQIGSLLLKTGQRNRTQVAVWAVRNGVV